MNIAVPFLEFLTALVLLPQAAIPDRAREHAGSSLREADLRIGSTVYRLGVAGRPYCSASHPLTGLMFHHLGEYEAADRPEAIVRFGLDKGPGVLAVVPSSPAARAGFVAGDVLLSAGGTPFPSGSATAAAVDQNWNKRRKLLERVETKLETELKQGKTEVQVLRGGEPVRLSLTPIMGCPARGRLARSLQANAFADGRYAIMTTKMLSFIETDDELAVAMAHELSHNILGHPADPEEDVSKGVFRLGKNKARARAAEEEADRLGIRLLWAAGYDVRAAIPFWRRLHEQFAWGSGPHRTHPTSAERERLLREVADDLGAPAGSSKPR